MKNSPFHLIAFLLILIVFTGGCQMASLIQPGKTGIATESAVVTQPAVRTQPAGADQFTPSAQKADDKGYVVLDQKAAMFHLFRMDGSEAFAIPAAGLQYPFPYTVAPVDGAVYYLTDKSHEVYRSSPAGVELVKIPAVTPYGIAVTADEKMIAWSTLDGQNGDSELWTARMDGSEAKQVVKYSARQSEAFLIVPVAWMKDGKLVFDRTLTGIGGYILYGGYNNLYSYDPATGQIAELMSNEEKHGLCLDGYRPDLAKLVSICGPQGPEMAVLDLKRQTKIAVPKVPEQGVAGTARFSPSGAWLAYATAANNPDNESGQVVVVPAGLENVPQTVAKVENNSYASVQGWLDENTILFTRNAGFDSTLWTVGRDGSGLKQVGSGQFVGWVR